MISITFRTFSMCLFIVDFNLALDMHRLRSTLYNKAIMRKQAIISCHTNIEPAAVLDLYMDI